MKVLYTASWIGIYLLTVSECSAVMVVGVEDHDVTLPCRYDALYHGALSLCWGRAAIPSSGCDAEVLSSDGAAVTSRLSDRYVLLGDVSKGDVSLTILNATGGDSGLYGCRVHIPGWFNDQKTEVRLTVVKASQPTTARTTNHVTGTPANHTQGHMTANFTEHSDVSTPQSSQSEPGGSEGLPVILVCVLLVILLLATVVLIVSRRRWKRLRATPYVFQSSGASVQNRDSVSSLGLDTREMAVENIYQLDETVYTNIYEP